jgi:SOS-response transcriptional repressor LexA
MSDKQSSTSVPVRPTKKQKELLSFIEAFINEHGYSPSYREIMNGLSYTSVATVALHVGNLIKRGHLRKRDHSARSLEVVTPTTAKGSASVLVAPPPSDDDHGQWLVSQVTKHFKSAEAATAVTQEHLDSLYVLLGALRVLGHTEAADGLMGRLNALQTAAAGSAVAG